MYRWARTPEPARGLDKHEFTALPKPQVQVRNNSRTAMAARRGANNRRQQRLGHWVGQHVATAATKSAGSDSAATQNRATSPEASASRTGPQLDGMFNGWREISGMLKVQPPMPTEEASAPQPAQLGQGIRRQQLSRTSSPLVDIACALVDEQTPGQMNDRSGAIIGT